MKRVLPLFLVLLVISTIAAGCSGDTPLTSSESSASAAATSAASAGASAAPSIEPAAGRELTIAAARFVQHVDWDQMYIWQKHYEDTGIKINWQYMPTEGIVEQRNLMVATREYPDAFWGGAWTAAEAHQYTRDGIFVPIDSYLPEYGPNITRFYEANPEIKAAMTLSDGHIYSYGLLWAFYQVENYWAFRSSWMEKLGLEYPETTAELMDVMMAMKSGDPNGNGQPDEFPFSTSSPNYAVLINMLCGSWGLANHGFGVGGNIDGDPNDPTKVRYYPMDDRFREVLRFARDMHANGLIDPETSFQTPVQWGAKIAAPESETPVGVSPSYLLSPYSVVQFFQNPNVLAGPYGDQIFPMASTRVGGKFNYVITDKCQDIPTAVQVADYWMDDGINSTTFFFGEEGTHYTLDADGTPVRTEMITNDPQGRSLDQMLSTFTSQPGGYYAAILKWSVNPEHNMTADAEKWMEKMPVIWEIFNMTEEEIETTSTLGTDLTTHYNESVTQFIDGTRDIDSDAEWDAYKATFEQLGIADHIAAYQSAYDRYSAQ